jgi:sulfur-oxidizing protein SoxA
MKMTKYALAAVVAFSASSVAIADGHGNKKATDTSPAEDLAAYRAYFEKRHPDDGAGGKPDFSNGVYSILADARSQWENTEEFPPYEDMVAAGEEMWNTPFKNGKSYADCFGGDPAQRKNYPMWDDKRKMVVTMELAVNECREANGEKPLKYKKGDITRLTAYMAYESRGQKINVQVPNDDALAAYNNGKELYFGRRGQLNFSCASCHVLSSGTRVRGDTLSMGLGHGTGWPVYRQKWGDLGTLHRRLGGCMKQMRAKPFKAQGEELRNMEYFLTHMSNGMEFNGPSSRK